MNRLEPASVPVPAPAAPDDEDLIWSDVRWPVLNEEAAADAASAEPTPLSRVPANPTTIEELRRAG